MAEPTPRPATGTHRARGVLLLALAGLAALGIRAATQTTTDDPTDNQKPPPPTPGPSDEPATPDHTTTRVRWWAAALRTLGATFVVIVAGLVLAVFVDRATENTDDGWAQFTSFAAFVIAVGGAFGVAGAANDGLKDQANAVGLASVGVGGVMLAYKEVAKDLHLGLGYLVPAFAMFMVWFSVMLAATHWVGSDNKRALLHHIRTKVSRSR